MVLLTSECYVTGYLGKGSTPLVSQGTYSVYYLELAVTYQCGFMIIARWCWYFSFVCVRIRSVGLGLRTTFYRVSSKIFIDIINMKFKFFTLYSSSTDIHGRSQNLRHFYLGMGLKYWGSSDFSRNQNNRGSSGMSSASTAILVWRYTRVKHHMARKYPECICIAFVFGKNPKTPNLSPMADEAITQGDIGCLGALVYVSSSDTLDQGLIQEFSMRGAQTLFKKISSSAWAPTHRCPVSANIKGVCLCFCKNKVACAGAPPLPT